MENASKALIMVGAVLLTMIVIAFMNLTFNKMGEWNSKEEDEVLIEQKQKFNKEYEVYDKDLMYGVDVISCLNKVKSNNDKISGSYAEKVDSAYAVTVKLNIKNPLIESIRVYHINNNKEEEYKIGEVVSSGKKEIKEIFKSCTNFENYLKAVSETTNIKGDYTIDKDSTSASEIIALLDISEVRQEVKNNDKSSAVKEDGWTRAVWETPLYDLKTRKFRCTGIEYNKDTGRINKIKFQEF